MSPYRSAGRRFERGVLLPLLALALAGGAAWFVSVQAGPGTPGPGDRTGARAPLLEARRALVAHAAAYPETYGPSGAGPGHLVCPDTDTPLGVGPPGSASRPVADFAGDGPNPPCGGAPLTVGRLPRHVSLGASRRAFHHESGQRLVYGVSTGYVNNPSGAAVHRAPDVGSSRDDVVAVIVDPGGASLPESTLAGARDPHELLALVRVAIGRESGAAAARALPHAFVTRGNLLDAAERRVAAWFIATATRAAHRRAATSFAPAPARDLAAGAVDSPVGGLAEGSVGGSATWPEAACSTGAATEFLRWVADEADPVCGAPVETIENTPRARHWFVRERWAADLEVHRHPDCRDGKAACRLAVARARIDRRDGTPGPRSPPAAAIVVELVPADARNAPDAPVRSGTGRAPR